MALIPSQDVSIPRASAGHNQMQWRNLVRKACVQRGDYALRYVAFRWPEDIGYPHLSKLSSRERQFEGRIGLGPAPRDESVVSGKSAAVQTDECRVNEDQYLSGTDTHYVDL